MKKKFFKFLTAFVLINFLYEILFPAMAWAITMHPVQQEFSGGGSGGGTELVNKFTGDFQYNIQLMDIEGYPLALEYNSGPGMNQDAGWVGFGWSLNPGSMQRNLRGIPDDFLKDEIVYEYNIKDHTNVGGKAGVGVDVLAIITQGGARGAMAKGSLGAYYDNYKGTGILFGLGLKLYVPNVASYNLMAEYDNQAGINVSTSIHAGGFPAPINVGIGASYNLRYGLSSSYYDVGFNGKTYFNLFSYSNNFTFNPLEYTPFPDFSITMENFSLGIGSGKETKKGNIVEGSLEGFYHKTSLAENEFKQPAIGTIYDNYKKEAPNAVLDYNREKEGQIFDSSNYLPQPFNTFDIFSYSANGVSGTFWPRLNDVTYIQEKTTIHSTSKSRSIGLNSKLLQSIAHPVSSTTSSFTWVDSNFLKITLDAIEKIDDTEEEQAYLKLLNEIITEDKEYFDSYGGDLPVSPELVTVEDEPALLQKFFETAQNPAYLGSGILSGNVEKNAVRRDKRTKRNTLITYLTALESSSASGKIENYKTNDFTTSPGLISRFGNNRKPHHLSEYKVIKPDGTRYVYGLPTYNAVQQELLFSINGENNTDYVSRKATGLAKYFPGENTKNNLSGRDNFFQKKELPPYATGFLLTQVLSPDYVDLTGNGISEDDLGTAYKFNYQKIHDNFKWRRPYENFKAGYVPGHLTIDWDDKGAYIYGERENWYLHSIESKNYIAEFTLSDRKDGFEVMGENGGRGTRTLKKLDKIDLYSKWEKEQNGSTALPVKTVHFQYNYSLCKNLPSNNNSTVLTSNETSNTGGKLTLEKVHFTFRDSKKGVLAPYEFSYSIFNPDYFQNSSDHWGNFENYHRSDFGNNLYTIQDKEGADKNSSAWSLIKVQFPSGSEMNIKYESDDYAFVQDKRAMEMIKIHGFEAAPIFFKPHAPNYRLYEKKGMIVNNVVFFKLKEPLLNNSKELLKKYYLEEIDELYFKFKIKLSGSNEKKSFEYVSGYAEIIDYGISSNYPDYAWIQVKPKIINDKDLDNVKKEGKWFINPFTKAGFEYARRHVPSKIYEFSDPKGEGESAIRWFVGLWDDMRKMFIGPDKVQLTNKDAKYVDLNTSFIRLRNPGMNKLGGGERVEKILFSDGWQNMKGNEDIVTGYKYDYSLKLVQEESLITKYPELSYISSGVASYEPMISGDANPFNSPDPYKIHYKNRLSETRYFEGPILESQFPTPLVGYRTVTEIPVREYNYDQNEIGYTVYKFFTHFDFPTRVDQNPIKKEKYEAPKYPNPFFKTTKEYFYATQGFLIKKNNMMGQLKGIYEYNGYHKKVKSKEFIYKTQSEDRTLLNSNIKVMNKSGEIKTAMAGKTFDVLFDCRGTKIQTVDPGAVSGVKKVISKILPWNVFKALPTVTIQSNNFHSAAATKIIYQTGILDEVKIYDEGRETIIKNILFDEETGEVLLTETRDNFDKPEYVFKYPSYYSYERMGPAYRNIRKELKAHNPTGNEYLSVLGAENHFVPGDKILVYPSVYNSGSNLLPFVAYVSHVDINKVYIQDRNGNKVFEGRFDIQVIESGNKNQQGIGIGTVALGEDPSTGSNLTFNNNKILDASAVVYDESWKTYCDKIKFYDCTLSAEAIAFENTLDSMAKLGLFSSQDYQDISAIRSFQKILTPGIDPTCPTNCTGSAKVDIVENTNFHAIFEYIPEMVDIADLINNQEHDKYIIYKKDFDSVVKEVIVDLFGVPDTFYNVYITNPVPTGNLWNVGFKAPPGSGIQKSCEIRLEVLEPGIKFFNITDFSSFSNVRKYPFADTVNRNSLLIDGTETGTGTKYVMKLSSTSGCWNYISCDTICLYNLLTEEKEISPYLYGVLGNWRPSKAYTYFADRTTSTVKKIKEDGVFEKFTPFWQNPGNGSNWTQNITDQNWRVKEEVSIYDPNGNVLEMIDPIGNYYASLFEYNHSFKIAEANNARYRQIANDNFEYYFGPSEGCKSEGHWDFSQYAEKLDSIAHTGHYSLKILDSVHVDRPVTGCNPDTGVYFYKYKLNCNDCIGMFAPDANNKYVISGWVREINNDTATSYRNAKVAVMEIGSTTKRKLIEPKGAIIDGWQRFSDTFSFSPNSSTVRVRLLGGLSGAYFDDIRIHPFQSNMVTYVYDPFTLQLKATLDENNYATIFEYDEEGRQVRVKKETSRGIYTVSEHRMGIYKNP